jgi:HEPN domain-containing protein
MAQEQLKAVEVLFNEKLYHSIPSWCQQVIEYLVMGLYVVYIDDNIPKFNDTVELIKIIEDKLPEQISEARYAFFNKISNFYLDCDYFEYDEKIKPLDNEECMKSIVLETKDTFNWLLTLIK